MPSKGGGDVKAIKHEVAKSLNSQRDLVGHLQPYQSGDSLTKDLGFGANGIIHPAIISLGLQYNQRKICGSNARCVAFLTAMKSVIADYRTPAQKELNRDLKERLVPCVRFLDKCRPISISMVNALKHLNAEIGQVEPGTSDQEAKNILTSAIDAFINEKVVLAGQAIAQYAMEKIHKGDRILVYGGSSLISRVLRDSRQGGATFSVVVVDNGQLGEGQTMVREVARWADRVTLVTINALSYVMHEVDKVVLGAHGLLANGSILSRIGTSQVALVASAFNRPVLVCCETYKFCERVLTDSFVHNELGDPDAILRHSASHTDVNKSRLTSLNLTYDVTPADFASVVITEVGCVPCTSVPVVLRLKYAPQLTYT